MRGIVPGHVNNGKCLHFTRHVGRRLYQFDLTHRTINVVDRSLRRGGFQPVVLLREFMARNPNGIRRVTPSIT
jgi:hypothetical protein